VFIAEVVADCIMVYRTMMEKLCGQCAWLVIKNSHICLLGKFSLPLISYSSISPVRGYNAGIKQFGSTDLESNVIAEMEKKCPEISNISRNELQNRLMNLLGHVSKNDVRKIMLKHPRILTIPPEKFNEGVNRLQNTINIKTTEMRTVFSKAPYAFVEPIETLLQRVDYLYTNMGTTNYTIEEFVLVVNCTLHKIKLRHQFLSRRGQYFTPDKEGRTKISNPRLCEILDKSKERFCSEVAKCTVEEYDLFKDLFEKEMDILQKKMQGDEPDVDEQPEGRSDFADILLTHLHGTRNEDGSFSKN